MAKIYLLGLMHDDIEAQPRLKVLLDCLNPDILTIEITKELETMNEDLLKAVKKRHKDADQNLIKEWGDCMYTLEYITCRDYSRSKKKPMHLIDYRDYFELERALESRESMYHYLRKLNKSEAELHMSCDIANTNTRNTIITYSKNLNPKSELEDAIKNNEIGKRDEIMARRILRLYNNLAEKEKIVHVGGLTHMLKEENSLTLYERLKAFNPKVIPVLEKYTRCCDTRKCLP